MVKSIKDRSRFKISRGDFLAKKCWEIRGCPQDMLENCIFGIKKIPCELPCRFSAAACNKYDIITSKELIEGNVDFSQVNVQKQQCFHCKVLREYLKNNNSEHKK